MQYIAHIGSILGGWCCFGGIDTHQIHLVRWGAGHGRNNEIDKWWRDWHIPYCSSMPSINQGMFPTLNNMLPESLTMQHKNKKLHSNLPLAVYWIVCNHMPSMPLWYSTKSNKVKVKNEHSLNSLNQGGYLQKEHTYYTFGDITAFELKSYGVRILSMKWITPLELKWSLSIILASALTYTTPCKNAKSFLVLFHCWH